MRRGRKAEFTLIAGAAAFFLLVAPATSLTPEGAAPATIKAKERASPPMWRLADADSEIWLLGTFHILPPELDWRSDALAAAADAAETYWFEAEVDTPAAQQKTMQIMTAQGFNKSGVTLTSLLDTEDRAQLAAVAADVSLATATLDPMRPWLAFLHISVQFIVAQGFDPSSGVETILLREARMRGRKLRFFETIDQQLGLFTKLPPETEKKLLVVTLRDWDKQKGDFDALFDAWRNGDEDAIDRLMNQAMHDEAPEIFEILVANRNKVWADQIATAMSGSGRILVAVGAGHLVGDVSVPALLREKGFTVERFGAVDN